MRNDYFKSEEFKKILEKYEASEEQGKTCYFDAEDFEDIADHYLFQDRPEDAVAAIRHGLSLHHDDEDLLSTLSGAYIYMHKYAEAREIIETLDPDEGNVMYQRAQLAYALDHDIERAEEIFTDWIEHEEKSCAHSSEEERGDILRDAYVHIITSFVELKDEDYDEELTKRWMEEYYARFAPLGSYDSDLALADLARNENMADMVEKIYTSILEYDPYINYGWVVLSTAQLMNNHIHEALDSLEFALALEPDNEDAILNKAHALYTLGQRDQALPLFEKFLAEIDDPNQYLPYAICLIGANREQDALAYLAKADENILLYIDNKEYFAEINFELAEAYLSISELEKSLNCIQRTLSLFPNDKDTLLLKGTVHLVKQEFEDCFNAFQKSINFSEDKVMTICDVAIRFIWNNQCDIALQLLETTEKFKNSFASYRVVSGYLAYAYLQMEDLENGLEYLKVACKECPDALERIFASKMPPTVRPEDYYDWLTNHPL